jgi:hypothetical protein
MPPSSAVSRAVLHLLLGGGTSAAALREWESLLLRTLWGLHHHRHPPPAAAPLPSIVATTATGSAPALKRPPGRPKVSGVLGSSRSLPRLRATGAARSPESTRVLAAVGATRQKYSRPRPVSGQYQPVLRGGGTAAYGGIRPVPEHLTWYSKTK